jgi:hypothetical protein
MEVNKYNDFFYKKKINYEQKLFEIEKRLENVENILKNLLNNKDENENQHFNDFNSLEKSENDGSDYSNFEAKMNNVLKVSRYSKNVFINTKLFNCKTITKNLNECRKRRSKYRGVSKNGNKWQVMMVLNKTKSYIGSYTSEEIAGRIYDILAIKYRGIKARTNFKYTKNQLNKIYSTDINIKSNNINDVIDSMIQTD